MSRIQNYTEFKSRLDNSVASLRKLMLVYPTELSLNGICHQLEALDEWSSAGHPPTLEQKGQLNFGLLAGYNLAPIDPDLTNELHALNYFLLYWKEI